MTQKRFIYHVLTWTAVLAFACQFIIDDSVVNIASACLAFGSSLCVLVYLGCTKALETQPLSSFAIFGFCLTTQLGALIVQTIAWRAVGGSLFDPLYTFGTLALYQVIAIGVHIVYRLFSAPKPTGTQFFRGLLSWTGLSKTPSCAALWIIGWIGLASHAVFITEAISVSAVGKAGAAFNFLAWAPFMIPFYRRQEGDDYCNWPLTRVLIVAYTAIVAFLGIAMNARGVMFFGVATIGLLYLLAGMRSNALLPPRTLLGIGTLAVAVTLFAGPTSDLVTAMAIARGVARGGSVIAKIETTFQVWRRPDIIAGYRAMQLAAQLHKSDDQHYIDQPIVERFVVTKFIDGSLYFAGKIVGEDAHKRLQDVAIGFFWGALPTPVLNFLGVGVDKTANDFSMGDYLAYLGRGARLGGHRVGSMFGDGIALLGPLFPIVFVGICVGSFALMDLLTIKRGGAAEVSALGLLQIYSYFMGGISFLSLHVALYFFVRTFWQTLLTYVLVFGLARLMLRINLGIKPLPASLQL